MYTLICRAITKLIIIGGQMSWEFSTDGEWQKFGWRSRNGGEWHYGRDYGTKGKLNVPLGVPKYCEGWLCHVVENNKVDGLGNQVVLIKPDGKEMVRFLHIETGTLKHLKDGQIMHHGDWIGNIAGVGNQEKSYQPHIHVEHGFNPKYELCEVRSHKKVYRGKMWFCGDHQIQDYRDPNKGALPFSELESLTDLAYQSRENIQAGLAKKVQISRIHPTDLVQKEGHQQAGNEEGGFVSWFRSTWIGRLFYSGEGENKNQPKERKGPIIHRKNLVPTPRNDNKESHKGQQGVSQTLSQNGQKLIRENQSQTPMQKSKEMG